MNKNWNTISENILAHYIVVGANTQTNLRQRQITGSKTNEDLPCVCAFSDMYKNIAIGVWSSILIFLHYFECTK